MISSYHSSEIVLCPGLVTSSIISVLSWSPPVLLCTPGHTLVWDNLSVEQYQAVNNWQIVGNFMGKPSELILLAAYKDKHK